MKAYELIEWLNEHHPQKFAEDWDNVGLLVGDDQKEISHVFLALDLTEPVLDELYERGVADGDGLFADPVGVVYLQAGIYEG